MGSTKKDKPFVEQRRLNYATQAALLPGLPWRRRNARVLMSLTLLLSDIASLLLAYGAALWLYICLIGDSDSLLMRTALPVLLLFLLVYAWYGLYPGVGLSPVYEMRRLFNATNTVFLLLIALSFWLDGQGGSTRFILAAAWLLALGLVQLFRWLVRILGRKLDIWGEPVAVVGNGPEGQRIVKFLEGRLRLGMRPVLVVDGFARYEDTPLVAINHSAITTLILVTCEMSPELQAQLVQDQRFGYHRRKGERPIQRLILISTLGWVGSQGVTTHDMDGMLGLEVRQNLLEKWPNLLKRAMDLALTVFLGLLALPFLLLIAVLINLDSRGGVFYRQTRVGRDGWVFNMWKFRTMQADADQVLAAYLATHPDKQAEWERTQKLKDDPRVTRVGKFLRRFSVDEVPQLINVLKGEMSLVGPRPIFPDQLEIFGGWLKMYQRVRPGMTGMWQVHGRSDIGFTSKERERLDEYYVRNWSVWLDIYILLRTALVVVTRQGAY